jgi:hypothetical protein
MPVCGKADGFPRCHSSTGRLADQQGRGLDPSTWIAGGSGVSTPEEPSGDDCRHDRREIWVDAPTGERPEYGSELTMRGRCITCGERLKRTRHADSWTPWAVE